MNINKSTQGKKWLNSNIEKEMLELLYSGKSKTEIAKFFNCGLTTVHRATKGVKTLYRKNGLNHNYFKGEMTPEKAYILGVISSDGNLYKSTKTISIAFNISDIDTLYWIAEIIGSNKNIIQNNRNDNCVQLRVTSYIMYNDLKDFGFIERKSFDGFYFDFSRIIGYENYFLLGLYDGLS